MGERVVDPQQKALAADWLKRIHAALARPDFKEAFAEFERNRKRLRGIDDSGRKLRTNLHFANMAAMLPQTYAKDPEFAASPTKGVPPEMLEAARKLGETVEAVLGKVLVKDCKLKKKAKRLLRATYATSVGWWKLVWQEDRRTDALIADRIADTQDNIARLEMQRAKLDDPQAGTNADLELAKLRELLEGLQQQSEIVVARGLALDFVLSEDVVIVDESIRELGDYERSAALTHRVWMTKEQYRARFGYEPKGAKLYRQQAGQHQQASAGEAGTLLCVWEVWDRDSNRVLHVCDGEEGFCCPPTSPDWTGKRWYPFFGAFWNEIDGRFYPLSDIELTHELVVEYNDTRDALAKDRKDTRPFTVARKGGSITDDDVRRIRNRDGNDIIMIEGVGNQPLSNDIQAVTLGQIDPKNYDTAPARQDMEQMVGGGDAARGSVLNAKTATEAEILSQGLRGRSAERQDTIEDLLSDVGQYALEVCLRKLTPEEVQRIAGPDAQWPSLSIEQVFDQLTLEVRGGSTGKPDRLQEQDRWTKLLPVIKETMQQVAELRMQGQEQLAQAVIELMRETLRRFDERLDIEQFLPPPPEGQDDPELIRQQALKLQQENQELQAQNQELMGKAEKGITQAATTIATSPDPFVSAQAFFAVLNGQLPDPNLKPMPPAPAPGAEGELPPEEAMPPEQMPTETAAEPQLP